MQEALNEYVNERLYGRGLAGLRWADEMPDDDPDAELLVTAGDGSTYVLEIDVSLISQA